jgi:hypothetical protein
VGRLVSYPPRVSAVSLREVTDENREAMLALRAAGGQEQFVGRLPKRSRTPATSRKGSPGNRAIHAGEQAVGELEESGQIILALTEPWSPRTRSESVRSFPPLMKKPAVSSGFRESG